MELKIASIKFISYADPEVGIPILIAALKDENLNVKLISLHRLNWLKAKEAISYIVPLLKDTDWWVRISAAEALKNMGVEGERVLHSNSAVLDKISFNLDHVLNKWY